MVMSGTGVVSDNILVVVDGIGWCEAILPDLQCGVWRRVQEVSGMRGQATAPFSMSNHRVERSVH